MNCAYCGSARIKIINGTFPMTYECKKCGKIFVEPNPMLI